MDLSFQIGGFSTLLVASVVWIDGLWLLEKVSSKSVVFINLFSSFIILSVSIFSIFSSNANITSIYGSAITLLISCTYFWLALNIMLDIENMPGLGWFALIVSATLAVLLISPIKGISYFWYVWNYINWLVWCVLFFLYFLMIVLKMKIGKLVGYYSILASIINAFMPGFLALMTNIK
jgi:putative amide transporter protein